jgi:uncharacterized protein YecT (DUF1311 family)
MMKTLTFVIGLFFVVLAAPPAWADALYDKCANTEGPKDVCTSEWHIRADHRMNEVWKSHYKNAEGQTKSDLLAEQRAWNAYKEKSCNFLRNGEWGQVGEARHYHLCRVKVIEDRIQELSAIPPARQGTIYDKCMEESDGTNTAWDTAWYACAYEQQKHADRKLNEVWQLLYKNAGGQTKGDLLAEQRAWNAYKEKSCDFYRNGELGREGEAFFDQYICRIRVITDRIREMQSYFSPSTVVGERVPESFRCFSGGSKNSIRLEWGWYKDAIPAHWITSYVKYKNSSKPIHLILKSDEGEEMVEGRPWMFTSTWLEVVDGKVTGEYKTVTQGANIYGFTYKDYRNGRIVDFSEDIAAHENDECKWK